MWKIVSPRQMAAWSRTATLAALFLCPCLAPLMTAQAVFVPRAPQVVPVFECSEIPANLLGTPLQNFVPKEPWAYFSTISTYPTPHTIPTGVYFTQFLLPQPSYYTSDHPTVFPPGYDLARLALFQGNIAIENSDRWTSAFAWQIGTIQAAATGLVVAPDAVRGIEPRDQRTPIFCRSTLIPALPVIPRTGTTTRLLLATLVSLPPPQAPVTVETFRYQYFSPGSLQDPNLNGSLANLYYQNGSIYGDVTPDPSAASPASWFAIRVRSGGTVLAFGHVPVLAANQCSGSLTPASVPGTQVGSPYTQTFTASGVSGPAYSSTGSLPPGLTFSNGTLSGTPVVAGTFNFTVVAAPADSSCALQTNYTLSVSGQACSADVTSQVAITFGGLKKNLATGQWTETVTLQNSSAAAITGPINIVVTNLSANATLANASGFTQCFAPSGMPYLTFPAGLAPGASGTVTLTFNNSQPAQSITFTPRIAAGGNQL